MKAHDVRKMHVCRDCHRLGIYADANLASRLDLALLVSAGPKEYVCPRHLSTQELVAKDCKELDEVRLCDVTPEDMKAIMRSVQDRRRRPVIEGA